MWTVRSEDRSTLACGRTPEESNTSVDEVATDDECDVQSNSCVPTYPMGQQECMPNEVDDGCPELTECVYGCCVSICGEEPVCNPDLPDFGCPEDYICQGWCCVPSCLGDQ